MVWVCKCQNEYNQFPLQKSFTSYLYKVFSSNPLHTSLCIYTEKTLAITKLKKNKLQKMLKLSVPHIGLQFYSCYCPEGITGVLLQSPKSGQGWEVASLTMVDRQRSAKRSNHVITIWLFYKPQTLVCIVLRQTRLPKKYFWALY